MVPNVLNLCQRTSTIRWKEEKVESGMNPILGGSQTESDMSALEASRHNCSWPELYYDKIQSLIAILKPRTIVEIGVAYGYHAQHILRSNPKVKYFGIDPFISGYDSSDLFDRDVGELFKTDPAAGMERLYSAVSMGLEREFGSRAEILRMSSISAEKEFEDESVDLVFVDGDHRFEAVEKDLAEWWPKIRSGGILVGDDYKWDGVRKAARRFFRSQGVGFFLLEGPDSSHQSFFAVKP